MLHWRLQTKKKREAFLSLSLSESSHSNRSHSSISFLFQANSNRKSITVWRIAFNGLPSPQKLGTLICTIFVHKTIENENADATVSTNKRFIVIKTFVNAQNMRVRTVVKRMASKRSIGWFSRDNIVGNTQRQISWETLDEWSATHLKRYFNCTECCDTNSFSEHSQRS